MENELAIVLTDEDIDRMYAEWLALGKATKEEKNAEGTGHFLLGARARMEEGGKEHHG